MKQFMYEMIIGGFITVVDAPASEAVPEKSHEEYRETLDRKNVIAKDVLEAISKVKLEDKQFIASAYRRDEIHG